MPTYSDAGINIPPITPEVMPESTYAGTEGFVVPPTVASSKSAPWILYGLVALALYFVFSDGGSFLFESEE